jgi:hypothetical protein
MRHKPFESRILFIRYMDESSAGSIPHPSSDGSVYFYDDAGQLARLPLRWTDVAPDDATVVLGAGRAHFRYQDLCRLVDLLTGLDTPHGPTTRS